MTPDTFSRIFVESSRQSSLFGVSSKTSAATCPLDSPKFTKAYEIWVTELRRDSLQRRKSALHIKEKGCSSWPTIQAEDGGSEITHRGIGTRVKLLARAREVSENWPTPHENCTTGAGTQGREGGENLQTTALWATPTSRDHKDGSNPSDAVETNCLLGRQAPRVLYGQESSEKDRTSHPLWRTPANQAAGVKVKRLEGKLGARLYDKESGRNAQYGLEQQVEMVNWHTPHGIANTDHTGKRAGPSGNELGRQANRMAKSKRLNPRFVSWLQGFPIKWTEI